MPSLADIPDRLIDPNSREEFVVWLALTPTQFATRRELAAIWRKATQTSLTPDHWERLKDTSEPVTDA